MTDLIDAGVSLLSLAIVADVAKTALDSSKGKKSTKSKLFKDSKEKPIKW